MVEGLLTKLLVFGFASLMVSMASASETYNFYFVKEKKENKEVQRKEVVEPVAPAVAKPVENQSVSNSASSRTSLDKTVKENNFKRWSLSLGVGLMRGSYQAINSSVKADDMFIGGGLMTHSYYQDLYAIEGRFAFNRYFNTGGEVLLSSNAARINTSVNPDRQMSPQLSLLMGVTPFHFSIFGAQFMELGFDLGILATDSAYTDTGNIKPILGPRLAFSFGEKVALIFSAKAVTSDDEGQFYSTMKLGYRW